jgi:hypothetical protein
MATTTITLSDDELELVLAALDSHRYWELADPIYRTEDGVREPGSDDPEAARTLAALDALEEKLVEARGDEEG